MAHLYRDAMSRIRLPAGTNGQFLITGGATGDPSWTTQYTPNYALAASGTVSAAATLDIVLTGWTAARGVRFLLYNFVPTMDDVELWMRFSTNAGVSYDAGVSVSNEGGVDAVIDIMGQVATFTSRGVACRRETAQDTDAVRFLFNSGNIASGSYAVYVMV